MEQSACDATVEQAGGTNLRSRSLPSTLHTNMVPLFCAFICNSRGHGRSRMLHRSLASRGTARYIGPSRSVSWSFGGSQERLVHEWPIPSSVTSDAPVCAHLCFRYAPWRTRRSWIWSIASFRPLGRVTVPIYGGTQLASTLRCLSRRYEVTVGYT
jgi:hypothetical protein